ncbi:MULTISPECIES: D-ribose pyranase [unclassified Sporolactobacillus]|uniref:D-ribose pyranase n=1 Tax=unclassified Sporolactobacillus TaxID=2628533 RepID=UPI002367F159|nr:D-ribose pyranase [Sporolactobacillus sp. CQH2019]MDD9148871.1 D-ribose pyranase [Sporolactobacillus sp. CQH2019]
MKKTTVINSQLSAVIAGMGHMDWLGIGDAGMPVPIGTPKIDLAVTNGLPSFIAVLKNVLSELKVQRICLAEEMKEQNPDQLQAVKQLLPDVETVFVPHSELKKNLSRTHAFIRTGEMTPYSNIILESGVTF